ncbi:MAG: hypothetical protein IT436_01195 [Phycisphaerales bacterium]|nr:hypothetical protein [Phycisphaerales bacterium]
MARLKRILRHPAAAVVLLAMLGVSVWMLPKGWSGGSTVGWFIGRFSLARPTGPRVITGPYIIREPGGLVLRDANVESMDAIMKVLEARPEDVLLPAFHPTGGPRGFFAPTTYIRRYVLSIRPWATLATFSDAELREAREIYLDWFKSPQGFGENPALADQLLHRDVVSSTRLLWGGIIHNTLTVGVIACLVYCLRWNLSPSLWRARNRARRLARGECPRCRYPLHGLAESKCPECGEQWGGAEEQAARA